MKKILSSLILLIVCATASYSQSVDEIYSSLKIPLGWKKELSIDSLNASKANENKIGNIIITRKNRKVIITLYYAEILGDSMFLANQEWMYDNTSCRNYNNRIGYVFGPTVIGGFYLDPNFCPKCDFDYDRKCIKLLKALSKWKYESFNGT